MYTGHVTAGGSICLEALTLSGSPGSWQPSYTAEGMLHLVVLNMIDTPSVHVQTPTGPGGLSGPLRIDFTNPLIPYSALEARSAYDRSVQNHRAVGWGGGGGGAANAAASGPSHAGGHAGFAAAIATAAARVSRKGTSHSTAAAPAAAGPSGSRAGGVTATTLAAPAGGRAVC